MIWYHLYIGLGADHSASKSNIIGIIDSIWKFLHVSQNSLRRFFYEYYGEYPASPPIQCQSESENCFSQFVRSLYFFYLIQDQRYRPDLHLLDVDATAMAGMPVK